MLLPNNFARTEAVEGVEIPIVDFSVLRERPHSEGELRALADELAATCRDVGFFYAEHHGIPDELFERARRATLDFFALPRERKDEVHISRSRNHRGYFPAFEENPLGAFEKDCKEGFDMALEIPEDDPAVRAGLPLHGPNSWPSSLPGFREALTDLYEALRGFSSDVVGLFARALHLPADYFDQYTRKPMCQLRILRYPAGGDRSGSTVGAGAHTDYGLVSNIWQMDHTGLEIQRVDGTWVQAPTVDGTLVCPIGDAIDILTNGSWRATVHRVVHGGDTRHSAAFFYDPDYGCPLVPLDRFVSEQFPARYAATTMGAHITRGFDGTFTYRNTEGSARHDA
jgi:isopenicillin N synthase-like dioxygenase